LLVAFLLGLAHLTVDTASGVVLALGWPALPASQVLGFYLLYNVLAFAVQPLVGLLLDRWPVLRGAALLGLGLAAAALGLVGISPWAALLLTGLGNSLFHVSCGVIAFAATPGRAAGPGLLIGPGALGVLLGRNLGALGAPTVWPALGLLALAGLPLLLLSWPPSPASGPLPPALARRPAASGPWLLGGLLLVAIGCRALAGGAAGSFGVAESSAALWLALAACLGKSLGGIVADRWGWLPVSVLLLGLAAASFSIAPDVLPALACGVLCFQGVTGVTLAALHRLWPRWPGLIFGLNCLVLFVGSLPLLLGLPGLAGHRGVLAGTSWAVVLLVGVALWRFPRSSSAPAGRTPAAAG